MEFVYIENLAKVEVCSRRARSYQGVNTRQGANKLRVPP